MQGLWSYISKTGQGPGKDFQYEIGEEVEFEKRSPWTLHCGKKKVEINFNEYFLQKAFFYKMILKEDFKN